MSERIYNPVPEFIEGAKGAGWKIEDARGQSGHMRPGVLHVPLDNECVLCKENHSHAVRNHELAHAEITLDKYGRMPIAPEGLRDEYLQVCEDYRIWTHINKANQKLHGSPVARDFDGNYQYDEDGDLIYIQPPALCSHEEEKWGKTFQMLDDKGRILFATAAGPSDQKFVNKLIDKYTPKEAAYDADTIKRISGQVQEMITGYDYDDGESFDSVTTPPIRRTFKAAAWLQKLLEPDPEPDEEEPDPNDGSDPNDDAMAEAREAEGDPKEGTSEAIRKRIKDAAEKKKEENRRIGKTDDEDQWCEMRYEEALLVRPLPGQLISKFRSHEEGTFIRSPHRWLTDQKIFGKKQRVMGGAVLIDDSGSMGLGSEEIWAILNACPGATIAVYSSDGSDRGTLRLVARDGKMCAEKDVHTPGGGNGVDGPALQWLGRQKNGNRVWISDGQVTGRFDAQPKNLTIERDVLLKKHNIRQVDPNIVGRARLAEHAVAALSGRKLDRGGRLPTGGRF